MESYRLGNSGLTVSIGLGCYAGQHPLGWVEGDTGNTAAFAWEGMQ
jgi:hypothetical protein